MASSLEFVEYVAGQLQDAGTITYKKMFGEYGFYCDGKFFGMVCNDQFLVKKTEAGKSVFPDLEEAPPYEGAKLHFVIDELENREALAAFVNNTCSELPMQKTKKKKAAR